MTAAQDFGGAGRPAGAMQGRVPGARVQSAPSAPPPPVTVTGAGAVNESRRSRAQQDALQLEDVVVTGSSGASEAVARVGARTFYQRGAVWQDAEISDSTSLPLTEVEFASEEYYTLIRRIPVLAQYFAQGEEVDVIHERRRYRVRARRG